LSNEHDVLFTAFCPLNHGEHAVLQRCYQSFPKNSLVKPRRSPKAPTVGMEGRKSKGEKWCL